MDACIYNIGMAKLSLITWSSEFEIKHGQFCYINEFETFSIRKKCQRTDWKAICNTCISQKDVIAKVQNILSNFCCYKGKKESQKEKQAIYMKAIYKT